MYVILSVHLLPRINVMLGLIYTSMGPDENDKIQNEK